MTYNVNYTDNTKLPIVVNDTEMDTQTSVGLIGKKYSRYGEAISENFLHLLENFANSSQPTNPIEGQLWYDNSNNIMKYYTKNNDWKSFANVFTSGSQPSTADSKIGDIWINTSTNKALFYINNAWIELGSASGSGGSIDPDAVVTNGVAARTRFDSSNAQHSTVEIIVNSNTVVIYSSDDVTWIPRADQYIEGSNIITLVSQFPTIKKGINLNPSGTAKYSIHNYDIIKLGDSVTTNNTPVTIDIGRGTVSIEKNTYDSSSGRGLTIRPTITDPNNGAIFSVRNYENVSKLWTGQSLTSSGTNTFCVGFNGVLGEESNSAKYNIKLSNAGDVTALTVSGSWIATQAEANAGSVTNKIMTPSVTKTLLDSYNFVPSGAIIAFAMNVAPTSAGWLACSGAAVSRTTYASLYAAIGTTYGSGDGSTTFNLPDFRGTFLRGLDNSRGIDTGRTIGSYQLDELKTHDHSLTDPGHFHTVVVAGQDTSGSTNIDGSTNSGTAKPTSTTTTGITINATGGTETRPKNYAILYCIKT